MSKITSETKRPNWVKSPSTLFSIKQTLARLDTSNRRFLVKEFWLRNRKKLSRILQLSESQKEWWIWRDLSILLLIFPRQSLARTCRVEDPTLSSDKSLDLCKWRSLAWSSRSLPARIPRKLSRSCTRKQALVLRKSSRPRSVSLSSFWPTAQEECSPSQSCHPKPLVCCRKYYRRLCKQLPLRWKAAGTPRSLRETWTRNMGVTSFTNSLLDILWVLLLAKTPFSLPSFSRARESRPRGAAPNSKNREAASTLHSKSNSND